MLLLMDESRNKLYLLKIDWDKKQNQIIIFNESDISMDKLFISDMNYFIDS